MTTFARKDRIRIVLLFMAAGPALGALPAVVPLTLAGFVAETSDDSGMSIAGAALMLSYLIGIVPAVLGGVFYQWIAGRLAAMSPRRTRIQSFTFGVLSGLAASVLTIVVFFLLQRDNPVFYAAILFCGMLGAGLCALIARRWTEPEPGPSLLRE